MVTDVTAQIDAERSATAVEHWLRRGIEASAVGTALLDNLGRAVFMNAKHRRNSSIELAGHG